MESSDDNDSLLEPSRKEPSSHPASMDSAPQLNSDTRLESMKPEQSDSVHSDSAKENPETTASSKTTNIPVKVEPGTAEQNQEPSQSQAFQDLTLAGSSSEDVSMQHQESLLGRNLKRFESLQEHDEPKSKRHKSHSSLDHVQISPLTNELQDVIWPFKETWPREGAFASGVSDLFFPT